MKILLPRNKLTFLQIIHFYAKLTICMCLGQKQIFLKYVPNGSILLIARVIIFTEIIWNRMQLTCQIRNINFFFLVKNDHFAPQGLNITWIPNLTKYVYYLLDEYYKVKFSWVFMMGFGCFERKTRSEVVSLRSVGGQLMVTSVSAPRDLIFLIFFQ